jgi:hypothetical protein
MLGLVRVDAHRGKHSLILLRQRYRALTASPIHAEGQNSRDTHLSCTCDDSVAIGIEMGHVEVRMGVDQHDHFTFDPGCTGVSKLARTI